MCRVIRLIFGADVVLSSVGDIADKQAVFNRRHTVGQHVDRRTGDLATVVAENAVAKGDFLPLKTAVFDRYTSSAGARIIVKNLAVLDGWVGSPEDFDGATITVIEQFERRLVKL